MLIRRIISNLREQNWSSTIIELVVLALGIFLAFQVDRWYERVRSESDEREFLAALSEDFAATKDSFVAVKDRHIESTESAIRLLGYQIDEPIDIDNRTFYGLFADIQLIRTADIRRSTYDFLISSGQIAVIRDPRLRRQMSEFFARVDGTSADMSQDLRSYWRGTFEPYVQEHLDHVALMHAVHERENMDLEPTLSPTQFHDVIGTPDFEAIVSDKWHVSSDLVLNYQARILDIEAIESLLKDNLARFAASPE
jgi:hypothetical protein